MLVKLRDLKFRVFLRPFSTGILLLSIILLILPISCTLNELPVIIPGPENITAGKGQFEFHEKTAFTSDPEISEELIDYFLGTLGKAMGIMPEKSKSPRKSDIVFTLLADNNELGEEGYILDISRKKISIQANTGKGVFYGIQSLFQMMPAGFFSENMGIESIWKVNCVRITDRPKYSWRGFMLDSGRQYHTMDFLKRYMDMLALFKINVFHWHLTENDGWRMEIPLYPKLTETGAFVANGPEQKGFYTSDEMKELVEYAKSRYIEIMPEIDLPGHADAALTAYPELSCLGKVPEKVEGHSPYLFCGGNENTYTFLKNVLEEVCEIFPFEYIHLGGDEAPKDIWDTCPLCQRKIREKRLDNSHELQQYFSSRLAEFLIDKDRTPVFWEDVLYHGDINLPQRTVIQWWAYRSQQDLGLRLAIERNHRVINSPNYYTYLNFPVKPWMGYQANRTFDFHTAYTMNPGHIEPRNPMILGMTACLWTDYNLVQEMLDERVFPRFFAISEQMWNPNKLEDWEVFASKAKQKLEMLDELGIDYDDSEWRLEKLGNSGE